MVNCVGFVVEVAFDGKCALRSVEEFIVGVHVAQ